MDYLGKLLIVDDDESLCSYLQTHLEKYFKIEICYNGQDGYEAALGFTDSILPEDDMFDPSDIKRNNTTPHIADAQEGAQSDTPPSTDHGV